MEAGSNVGAADDALRVRHPQSVPRIPFVFIRIIPMETPCALRLSTPQPVVVHQSLGFSKV
jgi:hypothetical protein